MTLKQNFLSFSTSILICIINYYLYTLFVHCIILFLLHAANYDSERMTLILAVTVTLTAVISVCVGLLIGSLLTCCLTRKPTKSAAEISTDLHIETTNPLYEEIQVSDSISSQKIALGENIAYGPVIGRTTRLNTTSQT